MIIVLATVCSVLHGAVCQEIRLPQLEADNPTPFQCMRYGQFALVEWARTHPNWSVNRWSCVPAERIKAKV